MKKTLHFLIALLLIPSIGSAELLKLNLQGMRAINGSDPRQVVPVRYRTEENPAYVEPDTQAPPHLTEAQMVGFMQRLIQLEEKRRGITEGEVAGGGRFGGIVDLRPADKKLNLSESQISRAIGNLAQLDRHFVDAISKERWDQIFGEMDQVAEETLDAKAGNWDQVIDKVLKKAVFQQKDKHSSYMDVGEVKSFNEMMSGTFSGIGASLKKAEKEGVKLEIVFPNSPAEKAGLHSGDIVTAVDGTPVAETDLSEIVKRIKGIDGTNVVLSVKRGGAAIGNKTVKRAKIVMANVYSKMLTSSIGYIYFSEFRGDTDKKVFTEIKKLKKRGMTSLVLDVRGNPGGRVTAVSSLTSEFLHDGDPIVTFKKQGQWVSRDVTDGDGMFVDIPVAILINAGSASASEILSGAMQDHVRAPIIIGERSYGKGSAQSIRDGGEGRAMKLTGSKWFTPDGRAINADHDPVTGDKVEGTGGVHPDIVVDISDEQAAKIYGDIYRELNGGTIEGARTPDPQLEKAVEMLGGGSRS